MKIRVAGLVILAVIPVLLAGHAQAQEKRVTYGQISLADSLTGNCLDNTAGNVTNGNGLQLWACNGGPNQQWGVTPSTWTDSHGAGGYYQIILKGTNKCVDNPGNGTVNGTQLQIWTCNEDGAQAWNPNGCIKAGGGYTWSSGSAFGTNSAGESLPMAIDDTGNSLTNGTKIQRWVLNDGNSQQWIGPGSSFSGC